MYIFAWLENFVPSILVLRRQLVCVCVCVCMYMVRTEFV